MRRKKRMMNRTTSKAIRYKVLKEYLKRKRYRFIMKKLDFIGENGASTDNIRVKLTRSEMTLVLKGSRSYSSSGGKAQENHTERNSRMIIIYSTLDADCRSSFGKVFVCRRKRRRRTGSGASRSLAIYIITPLLRLMISDYSSGELLYKNSSSSKGRISSQLSLLNYHNNTSHHNNIPFIVYHYY